MDSGPYEVEFRGEQHSLRVPAILLNSCVLQVHAPGKVKCSSRGVLHWFCFGQTLPSKMMQGIVIWPVVMYFYIFEDI